jgi:hypothetical protein
LYDNFAPFWPAVPRFKPVCKNYLGFDGSQFETRPFHVSVIVFVFFSNVTSFSRCSF